MDDNKILIDESSQDDYRLRVKNKYLRGFVRRFDDNADREYIDDLSREFKEELIDRGILNWKSLSYRYCGRHLNLHWGEHLQCYELLLADVVELIPTQAQKKDLRNLMTQPSEYYCFATPEEISSFGINTGSGDLREKIADHTTKIIQENEDELIEKSGVGKVFTVAIDSGA